MGKRLISFITPVSPRPLWSFLWIGGAAFTLFLVIVCLAQARRFLWPDYLATEFLQTVVNRQFDIPLSIFSLLGSGEVMGVLALLTGYLIFLKTKHFPLVFFACFFLFHVGEVIGKLFLFHPGPPEFFLRYSIPFFFPSALAHSAYGLPYSFPSGHVGRTVFLSTVLAFITIKYLKRRVKRVIVLVGLGSICLLMILSRVYLGEHWFSDVLGGALLGLFFGTLALVFW